MSLKVKDHFEKQYSNFYGSPKHISFVIYDEQLWKLCLQNIKEADLVADYGSGGGTLLYNVGHFSKARLLGIEQSELAIVQSKNLVPDLNVIKGNIMDTPLKNESIDFIFSTMVIEHVDDKSFIEEAYRTLKPGGYFFVTSVIKTKGAWYFYKNASGETVLEPSHLKEYKSIQEFENVLKPMGFTIIQSSSPRIRYPLLDPLLKLLMQFFGIKNLLRWKAIERLRLAIRLPIPGFFAAEVLAKKPH